MDRQSVAYTYCAPRQANLDPIIKAFTLSPSYSGHNKLQRKRTTEEHLKKRPGEENLDSGIQVQLEEDGDKGARQNWTKMNRLRPMLHWQRQDISQLSYVKAM